MKLYYCGRSKDVNLGRLMILIRQDYFLLLQEKIEHERTISTEKSYIFTKPALLIYDTVSAGVCTKIITKT